MATKNIPDPGFSDDDGTADPELTAALDAWSRDQAAEPRVLAALRDARLLVPVVAVLGESEQGPDGLTREKTSDMAVPTLQAPDGRRALPAFTSLDTLARWRADARPVAVPLRQALEAVAHEGADTLVLDLAGPVTFPVTGAALRALAEGRTTGDPLADPAVQTALRQVLAADPAVRAAHLLPAAATDGTLAVALDLSVEPQEAAGRLARAVAEDETLRARLVRGLDLALLPPDAGTDRTPFFHR
ncbi:SseB family protein [Streptomyces sp. NPDC059740]|uniref:SseB family protein n=1 Tax=Streptomyces sp. NPDC059740 TaxID=3346926 RepID=UPI0036662165